MPVIRTSGVLESSDPNQEPEQTTKTVRATVIITIAAASLLGLYALSRYNYLLFHGVVEVFAIVIAFAIFAIAWNTRYIVDSNYFRLIGVSFAFIAAIDICHLLSYNGMGVFDATFPGPNLSTQLWIAVRFVTAASFLIPLLLIRYKMKISVIVAGYAIVMALLFASIFFWQNFPAAYVEGVGLTTFKIVSEFVVSLIFLVAIFLLYRKRREFDQGVVKYLVAAMAIAVCADMAFTLYSDVYGIMNMVGHLLNVVSFFLIYQALVQTSLTKPYRILFRNLKQSETALANQATELKIANKKLEEEVRQRERTQQELQVSEEKLRLKLNSVLSPDLELSEQELSNVIDVPSLQETMNELYVATNKAFALLDLKGNILVATGWQDICSKFHRVNPQTCVNCMESDVELSSGVEKGQVRLYKCKNNMWDVVTPLFIADKHVGNVFSGQFFFEDETPDRNLFTAQAEKYGFDKEAYLKAFDRVPRYSRKSVQDLMSFYSRMSELISKLSYSNLKLAKSVANQRMLQAKLEEKAAEVEEYASQMEELAEDRAKQLKDAERLSAIGATAGMVGHDIRNPLQAITSELYLAGLEINALQDSEEKKSLQDSIRCIDENVVYINKIVADLQDFARPLNPKIEPVDLGKIVKDALLMVKVPPEVHVEENLADEVNLTADTTMLKRVLVNLIQNAVQAMPNGGDLKISAQKTRRQIEISVRDSGEGIPKEVQSKLFTPLVTTKSKGQGFGLSVVKRMTESMGGTVEFRSEEGKGTIFSLKFKV